MDSLSLPEIRAELAARGVNALTTYGGLVPLAEWNPYGMSAGIGGVNYRPGQREWRGVLLPDGGVQDAPLGPKAPAPFMLGVWRPVYPEGVHQHHHNANRCLHEDADGNVICAYGPK